MDPSPVLLRGQFFPVCVCKSKELRKKMARRSSSFLFFFGPSSRVLTVRFYMAVLLSTIIAGADDPKLYLQHRGKSPKTSYCNIILSLPSSEQSTPVLVVFYYGTKYGGAVWYRCTYRRAFGMGGTTRVRKLCNLPFASESPGLVATLLFPTEADEGTISSPSVILIK